MWPGWHLALPSSTGLPVASGTPFVDRTSRGIWYSLRRPDSLCDSTVYVYKQVPRRGGKHFQELLSDRRGMVFYVRDVRSNLS